jgi:hypothetical protein
MSRSWPSHAARRRTGRRTQGPNDGPKHLTFIIFITRIPPYSTVW